MCNIIRLQEKDAKHVTWPNINSAHNSPKVKKNKLRILYEVQEEVNHNCKESQIKVKCCTSHQTSPRLLTTDRLQHAKTKPTTKTSFKQNKGGDPKLLLEISRQPGHEVVYTNTSSHMDKQQINTR